MRVIIAGPRDFHHYPTLMEAIEASGFNITTVVSGKQKGVDTLGEEFANAHNIPIDAYPATWGYSGPAAGPQRNERMAKNADALIALWANTKGTKNMIMLARKHNLQIYIHNIRGCNAAI